MLTVTPVLAFLALVLARAASWSSISSLPAFSSTFRSHDIPIFHNNIVQLTAQSSSSSSSSSNQHQLRRTANFLTMKGRSSYGGGRSNKGDRSGNGRPVKSSPWRFDLTATNILLAINVVVFLAGKRFPSLVHSLMKQDRMIARGQTYRLVTSLFLHQSFYHIMTNSFSLYQIGPTAEKLFGTARFISTYLAAGILANVATFCLKSSPYSLGASGCTFGLVGAFATHFYRNRDILGPQSSAYLESIKRTVFINMMYGAAIPNIDNTAHIGGFLSGAFFAYLFGPRFLLEKRNGRTVRVDRPVIPYTKWWKNFVGKSLPGLSSLVAGGGTGGNNNGEGGGEGDLRMRPQRDPMYDD